MQHGRARRTLALAAACSILVTGLLALRHETTVAHVREALTGALAHAHALADHHEQSATPHLHGRDVEAHPEAGACALLAALDHATILADAPAGLAAAPSAVALEVPATDAVITPRALYLLAPKTSPPAIA